MIVITVARKPLVCSVVLNALRHGTGVLNIDSCRIGFQNRSDSEKSARPGHSHKKTSPGILGWGENCMHAEQNPAGRWPSNFILMHLPTCSLKGIRRVRGIGGGQTSGNNAFGQDTGWNTHNNRPTGIKRQLDDEGMETIPNWLCAAGCPAEGMDRAGFCIPAAMSTRQPRGGGQVMFGHVRINPNLVGKYDSGGASRFFKQVGGRR